MSDGRTREGALYLPNEVSNYDPNRERREYALDGDSPLVGLIDNDWYPPYLQDRSHYHNCLELGVCLAGQGRVELGSRVLDFCPGTVIAAGKGLHHCQENAGQPSTHWRYVIIDEEAMLRDAPMRHRPALRRVVDAMRREGLYYEAGEENSDLRFVLQSIFRIYNQRGEAARMEMESLTNVLACIMARSVSPALEGDASPVAAPRKWIESALQYVSENYAQEVRMDALAASCAMSTSYFRKVFFRIMNMTPLEYVNRYRINRAANLMQSTDAPIYRIAEATGFSSLATFNRNFRRYTGKSPTQWRRSAHI